MDIGLFWIGANVGTFLNILVHVFGGGTFAFLLGTAVEFLGPKVYMCSL